MTSTNSGLAFALVMAIATAVSCAGDDDSLTTRQAAVAEAGAAVMPFNLDQTTHIFTNTDSGGVQDVVADDPDDAGSIEQIRLHLDEEASKFGAGDFSDPEAIHGSDMPGLATLKARYDEIVVDVATTETGATITYTTSEPELVAAIHDWFQAQNNDHGDHAEHNP